MNKQDNGEPRWIDEWYDVLKLELKELDNEKS